MSGRRMSPDEWFDELDALGRHIWEALPSYTQQLHQIDRERLEAGAQCVCTCGAVCPFWVTHLIDVREHADYWARAGGFPRLYVLGADQVLAAEVGGCCGHEYGRHLTGLDGCADCEKFEPEHGRCAEWCRQMPK